MTNKLLGLLCFILLTMSVSGVAATWWYGEEVQTITGSLSISYFTLDGENWLPDQGDQNETAQLPALNIIIDALNNKGLSGTSKLNQYITKRLKNFNKVEYGSPDTKQSVNELLSDVGNVVPNFEFILQGVVNGSGNSKYIEYFYLYMIDNEPFNAAMQAWESANLRETDYIKNPSIFTVYFTPVNRILIEKDAYGRWHATSVEQGYCGYGYYDGSNNGGGQKVWTFDPDSWQKGEITQ